MTVETKVIRLGFVLILALLMFFAGYSLGQTSTTVNPFAITLQGSLEGTVWVNLCETNQIVQYYRIKVR